MLFKFDTYFLAWLPKSVSPIHIKYVLQIAIQWWNGEADRCLRVFITFLGATSVNAHSARKKYDYFAVHASQTTPGLMPEPVETKNSTNLSAYVTTTNRITNNPVCKD